MKKLALLFIGLFIVVDNLDSNEQIITNSDAEKPATNTNLNSNAIQNSETSIAVSNQNETSESNKNVVGNLLILYFFRSAVSN